MRYAHNPDSHSSSLGALLWTSLEYNIWIRKTAGTQPITLYLALSLRSDIRTILLHLDPMENLISLMEKVRFITAVCKGIWSTKTSSSLDTKLPASNGRLNKIGAQLYFVSKEAIHIFTICQLIMQRKSAKLAVNLELISAKHTKLSISNNPIPWAKADS